MIGRGKLWGTLLAIGVRRGQDRARNRALGLGVQDTAVESNRSAQTNVDFLDPYTAAKEMEEALGLYRELNPDFRRGNDRQENTALEVRNVLTWGRVFEHLDPGSCDRDIFEVGDKEADAAGFLTTRNDRYVRDRFTSISSRGAGFAARHEHSVLFRELRWEVTRGGRRGLPRAPIPIREEPGQSAREQDADHNCEQDEPASLHVHPRVEWLR